MKCEKCGCNLPYVQINDFQVDEYDWYWDKSIKQTSANTAIVETTKNWRGYGLSKEEMSNTIRCPKCKQYPFENNEIQIYDVVRIVMFKRDDNYE